MDDPRVYGRHFTRDEANAMLPRLRPMLEQLIEAKGELTDAEAHEALSDAAPGNGGGDHGPPGRRGLPRGPQHPRRARGGRAS